MPARPSAAAHAVGAPILSGVERVSEGAPRPILARLRTLVAILAGMIVAGRLRPAGLVAAAVLAALPARAGAGDPSRAEAVVGGRILSVPVPGGLGAAPVPRGLLLSLREARRSPYNVMVTIEPAAAPPDALPRRRRDGGTLLRYRLDQEEGGSGGAEVTLTAERPCDGAALRLVLRTQAEIPSASLLDPAWAVLRGAACHRRDVEFR